MSRRVLLAVLSCGCMVVLLLSSYVLGWEEWEHDVGESELTGAPELLAGSPREVANLAREAMLSGRPVRVEFRPDKVAEDERDYWCRSITERDKKYALRQIARIRTTTDRMFHLDIDDPIERERELANQLRIRAMVDAAARLVADGEAFMTRGLIGALRSDDAWHYWNMRVHYKDEGGLMLYVPIDLSRFPDVLSYRDRAHEIAAFAETQRGFAWNNRDYTERRRLVDAAESARRSIREIHSKIDRLEAIPSADRTAADIEKMRSLSSRLVSLQDVVGNVPPLVNRDTMEWEFR